MSDRPAVPSGIDPPAHRLKLPHGHGPAPEDIGPLPWSWADERIAGATSYWLATSSPQGRPHVTPVWGAWIERALYFDGIPTARWARDLAHNPAASVHLESAADVVILDGMVEDTVTDGTLADRIVQAWTMKYGRLLPDPAGRGMFCFRPTSARGWNKFPLDATRWSFVPDPG